MKRYRGPLTGGVFVNLWLPLWRDKVNPIFSETAMISLSTLRCTEGQRNSLGCVSPRLTVATAGARLPVR